MFLYLHTPVCYYLNGSLHSSTCMCISTCGYSHLYVSVPALLCTDPAREEGAVLELAQVESDEICSCHEHQGQQGCVWFSNNLPRIPGGYGVVAFRWRHGVVSMVTVLERMLLEDLKTNTSKKSSVGISVGWEVPLCSQRQSSSYSQTTFQ